jgi:hypothetical protein
LHLLAGLDVEPARLSDRWYHATGGSWIVDVQPASDRAGNYIAKYSVQQATLRATPEFADLKGQRFVTKSHDVQCAPFRQPGGDGWRVHPAPYWPTAAVLRKQAPVIDERVQGHPAARIGAWYPI